LLSGSFSSSGGLFSSSLFSSSHLLNYLNFYVLLFNI
jgi:hypothetical protein